MPEVKYINMQTGCIKQTATFNTRPMKVYELLMDAKKHSQLTGAKASINKNVNGKFTLHNGYISGYNIELVPGKKIIQAAFFAEKG